jgi:hypothetical protein
LTISYNSGRRIQGTSTDVAPIQGGWKEIARTTLDGTNATIDVSWTPDKRYYMILMDYTQTSDFSGLHRLGNSSIDTGNNYHNRQSSNGGSDSSSQATWVRVDNGWQTGDRKFAVEYIADLTNKEKLIINHMARSVTTGAGQAPQRSEVVSKWVPSTASDTIGKFQMMNGGNYADDSQVVVLGWDPADTHTDNFWEELASVDMSGGTGSTLTTGTFTAKKYLWIQVYVETEGGGAAMTGLEFNGDTANNYGMRTSTNGGSENIEDVSIPDIYQFNNTTGKPIFANYFVINNSANEKLLIGQSVRQNTAGAGYAPERMESVSKWANISSQITRIDLNIRSGYSGVLQTPTIMKVWGHD